MNYNTFDKLAAWVESIRFDQASSRWVARFFPGTIIESKKFEAIVNSLAVHVMREIVQLVAEGLGVDYKQMRQKSRERKVTDAKQVAAIIIAKRMPDVSYIVIGKALGWSNHSMVHHSLNNAGVPEIAEKVRRVTRRYEILNN